MAVAFPARATAILLSSAATVNATAAVDRKATLFGLQCENTTSARIYLKLYDKATTPSQADTPRKVLSIPPGAAAIDFPHGLEFANGIGFRLTTDNADVGTTAVAVGDILGLNLDYT